MSKSLNPGFKFDLPSAEAASPWELTGLVREAKMDPASQHGSSADSKVAKRLQARVAAAAVKGISSSQHAPALTDGLSRTKRKALAAAEQQRLAQTNGAEPRGNSIHEPGTSVVREDTSGASAPEDASDGDEVSDTSIAELENAGPFTAAEADKERGRFFDAAPMDTKFQAANFAALNLSRPLLKACAALGYTSPTPIQAACIPLALLGRDICGSAQTGSGKTAAFALPLLERLLFRSRRVPAIYVLVLTPTRELAVQVHSMITQLAKFTDVRVALVVGGLSLSVQAATLRTSPEVVVATPGRLIDHLRNSHVVGLEDLQVLVLDEADRLLGMGFTDEVQQIVALAPRERQTLLFSATMTEDVEQLVHASLRRPLRLAADTVDQAPSTLTQEIVRLKGAHVADKEAALIALASSSYASGKTIVFFGTKVAAHRVKLLFGLAQLPAAAELHGNMSQTARLEALDDFRKGEVAFLLATDVAARGLDILGVENVINFDAPSSLESYLHRIGRTARAGAAGRALTFVLDSDRSLLKQVVKRTGAQLQVRVPPAQTIRDWGRRVEALERDVQVILAQEREEMELRRAEMTATKAENLIQYSAEIAARPARTWFQSAQQKQATAAMSKPGAKQDGKAKSAENRDKLKRRRAKEPEDTPEELKAVAAGIKKMKGLETAFRGQGVTGGRAGKMAKKQMEADVMGNRASDKKSKRRATAGEVDQEQAAVRRPSKVYSGGATVRKFEPKSLSKQGKNQIKRGGSGKRSFKSKAKHKRR
mmetsp:Transcript_5884/g.16788  ORF Transcript_5884/g.16788 Transcript_5884/m.16788 type:complete len:768 (-) Transcript_5884:94-2397(-)